MMILGSERDEQIAKLELPDAVLRLTRGEEIHPLLSKFYRPLAYSLEPEDFSPTGLDIVPLWEGESSITGFVPSESNAPMFIVYDIEYIDEYEGLGSDIRNVFRKLIREHIEDSDVDALATSLGYSTDEIA